MMIIIIIIYIIVYLPTLFSIAQTIIYTQYTKSASKFNHRDTFFVFLFLVSFFNVNDADRTKAAVFRFRFGNHWPRRDGGVTYRFYTRSEFRASG